MLDRVTLDIIVDRFNMKKKNGIYSYKGIPYIKYNNELFIGYIGTIYQFIYGFLTPVGKYEFHKINKAMKEKYKILRVLE